MEQNKNAYQILIVDDEPSVIAAYKRLLRDTNFSIHTASNRMEALLQMRNFRVRRGEAIEDLSKVLALVILDQNLEDHDDNLFNAKWETSGGLTLIQEAKVLFPLTRVLVITAYAGSDADLSDLAKNLKVDGYLGKSEIADLYGEKSGDKGFLSRVREQIELFQKSLNEYHQNLDA